MAWLFVGWLVASLSLVPTIVALMHYGTSGSPWRLWTLIAALLLWCVFWLGAAVWFVPFIERIGREAWEPPNPWDDEPPGSKPPHESQ
jgi:hypothetical protein